MTHTLRRGSEDLSSLYSNRVFHSDSHLESHAFIANELADHQLQWRQGKPDVSMYKASPNTGNIQAYILRYGAAVDVRPKLFDQFVLVHLSLRGGLEIECDGTCMLLPESASGILNPRKSLRLRWHEGSEQLILKLHSSIFLGEPQLGQHIPLQSLALVRTESNPVWNMLVRTLLNATHLASQTALSAIWVEAFERHLGAFLLAHQNMPSKPFYPMVSGLALSKGSAGIDQEQSRLTMLLEYIERNIGTNLSLDELAIVTGTNPRTLNALCHRHIGLSPMTIVRNMRLDHVRNRLLLQPDVNITAIASRHGFSHAGRFAAYYRERFGELPRNTLKGAHE